MIIAVYMKIN